MHSATLGLSAREDVSYMGRVCLRSALSCRVCSFVNRFIYVGLGSSQVQILGPGGLLTHLNIL